MNILPARAFSLGEEAKGPSFCGNCHAGKPNSLCKSKLWGRPRGLKPFFLEAYKRPLL